MPRSRLSPTWPALVALLLIVAIPLSVLVSMALRPHWQLTATNTPDGARVVVTAEDSPEAVYTVDIVGGSITEPFKRKTFEQLTSPDVETQARDVTLRPGYWKVVIDGVTFEIMEARIIVDGLMQGGHGETLTVTPNQ